MEALVVPYRSAASFLHAIEGLAKLVAKALQLSLNVTNEAKHAEAYRSAVRQTLPLFGVRRRGKIGKCERRINTNLI